MSMISMTIFTSLHFAYFFAIADWQFGGSINHIIDISKIGEIISSIANEKKVVLKIIGGGERKELLISAAEENGATVHDYGCMSLSLLLF